MKNNSLKCWLAAVLCLAATLTANADYDYDFMVGGIAYRVLSDLKSVEVTCEQMEFDMQEGYWTLPAYNNLNGPINIPSTVSNGGKDYRVVAISGAAFQGCSGLTSITIPNTVTSIGASAFECCTGLTNITFGNSVTSIGLYAFWCCNGLTSVTLPNSLTSIEERAFGSCKNLSSVTFGNSITQIGFNAFDYCYNLTSVHISDLTSWLNIAYSQWAHPFEYSQNGHLYLNGSEITSLVIPAGTKIINSQVFNNCVGITSVTIPESVTTIGGSAFYGCTGLKSVVIPNSVTEIGGGAFQKCSSLTSITLPNAMTTINGLTFSGCTSLSKVSLGPNLKYILFGAFEKCESLKTIVCLRSRPPEIEVNINWQTFSGAIYSTATVHVPKGSLSVYYSAPVWMHFDNYIDDADCVEVKGDINGDWRVDIDDVNAVVNLILGRTTLYSDQADVTGDGRVNVADLNTVINTMLGR